MSTDISGVDPEAIAPTQQTAESPTPGPEQPYLWAYPPPVVQTKPPLWRRPLGVVLIVLGVLGAGLGLLVGLMVILAQTSTRLEPVMVYDFAAEGDRPMVVEDGLSWDQSNGTLNLYPTDNNVERLNFDVPAPSDAMKVEATLIEPAVDEWLPMLWGIEVTNSATHQGVALLCAPGGTMYLADASNGEPLPGGVSEFACQETMDMSLSVEGKVVAYAPDSQSPSLYIGEVDYGNFDTASVVVYAQDPDQVLRVAKIAVYQPER